MVRDVNLVLTGLFCERTLRFFVIVVMESAKRRQCYGKYP